MIDLSKLIPKPGGSRFAPSGAVTDKILLEIASQYETAVSRRMTAIKPEELPRRFPGTERAELYLPGLKDGRRAGIADVIRVSFGGSEAELGRLRLAMLDVIMLDGKDLRPSQEHFQDTWQLLERLFGAANNRGCHRAAGSIVPENQVAQAFATRTAEGQEGLVIRRLNRPDLIKVKPHLTVDAAIVGYVEGEFEGQFGVTSILTALTYPVRQDHTIFFQTLARVGSGLSDAQRLEFREIFSGLKTQPPIPMTDSDGRAVSFVKPRYILEIEGDDLLLTAGGERENRTQLFGWNSERFSFMGLVPCPRLMFPIFARLRPDKDLESGGARLEQIIKNPVLPTSEESAPAKPEVLRREVYTKAEAVRKLVVVRQSAENCVPYLVYWTDFSPKRKDPLKVSSAFGFTEARARALAEKLIAENITKGFQRADGNATAPPLASPDNSETEKADPTAEPAKPSRPKKSRKAS